MRSLALEFRLADGEQWRTAMNSTPVFGVRTPQQFYEQLVAARPDPPTRKPDPKRLAAFFGKYPETQPFRQWVKDHPLSGSFATTAYYGINAFVATDGAGVQRAVRWRLDPETPASAAPADGASADFLARDLASRLAQGPLRWHLVVTVAQPGDPTADATQAWPAERQQIDAGTLVLQQQSAQQDGSCRDINYDPTILPRGLSPSDDPLLAARSSAYAESYRRRSNENAQHQIHAGAGQ
nr:catalase family peroxidase [Cupriavidus necator]